jgi:hypothetical protein
MTEQPAPAEPEVIDAEPAESNGEVAVPDDEDRWEEPEAEWPHQWLDFKGDKLAVRKPLMRQLTAYSIGTSMFMTPTMRTGATGKYMATLMSEESFNRVMNRYMDPDAPDYDDDTVGELIKQVTEMTTSELEKPNNRAERRHPTSPG